MKKWIFGFAALGCAAVAVLFASSNTDDCKCRGTKEKCCPECPCGK